MCTVATQIQQVQDDTGYPAVLLGLHSHTWQCSEASMWCQGLSQGWPLMANALPTVPSPLDPMIPGV